MENPYKILGISESASDETVKDVYRELCKRYHPDLAGDEETRKENLAKMEKINAAYDEIMKMRRNKNNGFSSGSFSDIRSLINNKRIAEAEELLDGVPENMRNAEWHFLKASVLYSRGWFNEAYSHFESAASMDPQNAEYRAAFNRMSDRRNGNYYPGGYRMDRGSNDCGFCNTCSTLLCCDCCCESMGGDFIPCC